MLTGLTETKQEPTDKAGSGIRARKRELAARPGVPLGSIRGIPISLDYSWFLIFALLTWTLASNYYPSEFRNWSPSLYWATGAATAIMLFVSVVLHELGHSFVAQRFGISVRGIRLFIFGGVAEIAAEPPSAKIEFLIAVAGPAVSFALAAFLAAIQPLLASVEPLGGMVKYLTYMNLALVAFNLIPAFPLDGGRVFRSVVWTVTKNMRQSTVIAGNVGRGFGFLFILVGVWRMFSGDLGGGMWIAFIGWFLDSAASAQINQAVYQGLLTGHSVSQAMSTQCVSIPADLTLQQLVDEHVLGTGRRCFLVTRGTATTGLMTLHRIKEVSRADWTKTSVSQAMLPLDELKHVNPATDLFEALQLLGPEGVNQLPVMNGGEVVGMLSREDVISYLRTLQELSRAGTTSR